MTANGRRYGEKNSHPIPVWNGIFDHYERIGAAIWTFLWLIDRIPKDGERDGVGRVLGGKPIKISEIVQSIRGLTHRSARRQLDALECEGYISRRRTPYGYVIEVRNSRKWNVWASKESGQIRPSLPLQSGQNGLSDAERVAKNDRESGQKGRNKENTAVRSSKETQQRPAPLIGKSPLWGEIEVASERLPGTFVKLCEELYARKGSQPLGEFLGVCMDAWQAMGGKGYPPAFARAKARVLARGKHAGDSHGTPQQLEPIRVLSPEEIPA